MASFLSPLSKKKSMAKSTAEVSRENRSGTPTPDSSPRHRPHFQRNQSRPRGGADSYPDTPKRLKSGGVQGLLYTLKTKFHWRPSRHHSSRRWGREKSTSQPDVRRPVTTDDDDEDSSQASRLRCDVAGQGKCASTNASPLLVRRRREDTKPCDLVELDSRHWREHGPQDAPLVRSSTREKEDSSDADEFDDCPSPLESFSGGQRTSAVPASAGSGGGSSSGQASQEDRRRASDNWKRHQQRMLSTGLTAGSIIRRLSTPSPDDGQMKDRRPKLQHQSSTTTTTAAAAAAAKSKTQSLRTRAKEVWQHGARSQQAGSGAPPPPPPPSSSTGRRSTTAGAAGPTETRASSVLAATMERLKAGDGTRADALPPTHHGEKERRPDLKKHPFFQLHIHLKRGVNLVAMDSCGTSDPYVKFKIGGKLMYKSKIVYKDLNPYWDEYFTLPVEDAFEPIQVKVFDYDWGFQDDFMGSATIDMSKCELYKPAELELPLTIPNREEPAGDLLLTATLYPKSQEDWEEYLQRGLKGVDTVRKLKSQIWTSVVTVVIVEAKDLTPRDQDGTLDTHCRFRMGNEKYRSKTIPKSTNPKWLEQFDLHLYDDQSQLLEVTVWDHDVRSRDEIIGRCTIDLSELERENTHRIKKNLEEGSGSVFLLLTITGTTNSETISDLNSYQENPKEEEYRVRRYNLLRTWHNLKDIGHLTVKVYKAQGLAAADLGGKSDPFCVLELVNARLQTQTEYKTLTPNWQKIFTFNVKDIHSVLEVTVYDEDRDNKVDFLGKVAIPLLRIRNGEKRWYALKDKKLRRRAKGTNPQILLEMSVMFNPVRAAVRTFDPAEEKYMSSEPKFKRETFVRNVMRLRNMAMAFVGMSKTVSSCLEWESPPRSIFAFVFFMVATYSFELYMVPIVFLAFFLKNYLLLCVTSGTSPGQWEEIDDMEEEEVEGGEEMDEEKKTWKEKLQAIQEVTQTVQNVMGSIASMWERTLNVFNFTVPFLSILAILVLCVIAIVLYAIPLRALIFVWGVHKFTKKLLRPHALNNNEVLDFLSRVPDGDQMIEYREMKLIPRMDSDKRKDHKKSKRVNP